MDTTEDWDERSIFLAALELEPEDREAFLRGACPDQKSRERMEQLLRLHDERPPEEAPRTIGEFQVVRKIGEGGMGVVYLARDELLGRFVALKTLSTRLTTSETAILRFYHEARAAAKLTAPGIVQVYQFGEYRGTHYISMEFVDGQTLAAWMRVDATPEPERPAPTDRGYIRSVASIVEQIATALEVAHSQDPPVIHRDIKPSNIMIDRDERVKIMDFGIAKVMSEEPLTLEGQLPGTPHYMSPEQAVAGQARIDHRSDIFSLGVVLYEALTHQRPFEGDGAAQILDSLKNQDERPVASVNRAVPVELATICHKALEKHPVDRYQSAIQMAADLRSFLRGDPILAMPPSVTRRARRWIVKRRALLAAVTILALLVVASALAYTVNAARLAQLGTIAVTTTDAWQHPEVFVMRHDADGRGFGAPRSLGRAPVHERLAPGAYRVVLVADSGQFAEFDTLARTGERSNFVVPPASPAPSDPTQMVGVPGGSLPVRYLALEGEGTIERTEVLNPFLIDRAEVSNAEYLTFLLGLGAGRPAPASWGPDGYSDDIADLPVSGISWADAQAYAISIGKRLPTLEEWLAAAQAPDGRPYPWGDAAPSELAAHAEAFPQGSPPNLSDAESLTRAYGERTRPVLGDPELATPSGLHHTFGNVSEFTATFGFRDPRTDATVVTVGSHWLDPQPDRVDLGAVLNQPIDFGSIIVGFRCVRSLTPKPTESD